MHPHIIGHRSRIAVLAELLDHITAHDGIWFGTHAQVVDHVLARRAAPSTRHREHRPCGRRDDQSPAQPHAAQGDPGRRDQQHRRMGRLVGPATFAPVFAAQFFAPGSETTALLSNLGRSRGRLRDASHRRGRARRDRHARKKGLTLTMERTSIHWTYPKSPARIEVELVMAVGLVMASR
jgi:hypothetical protein